MDYCLHQSRSTDDVTNAIVGSNNDKNTYIQPHVSNFQAFVGTGINLQLQFKSNSWSENPDDRVVCTDFVDFDREPGKVRIVISDFYF